MKSIVAILISILAILQLDAQTPGEIWIDACGRLESGDYVEANALFSKLIDQHYLREGRIYLFKGMAQYCAGDMQPARTILLKAKESGLPEADIWLAKIAMAQNQPDKAIDHLKLYLNTTSATHAESVWNDSVFFPLRGSDGWFDLVEFQSQNPIGELKADVGYYLEKQNYKEAHNAVNRMRPANNHESAEMHVLFSQIYSGEKAYQLAINEINQALVLKPEEHEYLKLKYNYLTALGKSYEAISILNMLLQRFPEDFELRKERVITALELNDFETAAEDMDILLKYFPTAENRFLKGKIKYGNGNYLDALKEFNYLIKEGKPRADYFKARGMTYYQTRTFDQAAYDLSMSLDLVPDDGETNYYLGLSERRRGNTTLSCYYLSRAQEYGELRAREALKDCAQP
jgi:tetratricopeptide (TPR) repeat protein